MTHTRLKSLTLITLTSLALGALGACTTRPAASTSPIKAPVAKPVPKPVDKPVVTPTLSRAAVRDKLAARRQLQIDRLTAYSAAGSFPKNYEQPGLLNIFIGPDGAICAAANLMFLDGHEDLVRKTASSDNYLRLVTVKNGPLMDWMLGSGLTQAEIDRVQEPYMGMDEPIDDEPQIALAEEISRLQAHFAVVLAELEANKDASLDAATDRLLANPALVATL